MTTNTEWIRVQRPTGGTALTKDPKHIVGQEPREKDRGRPEAVEAEEPEQVGHDHGGDGVVDRVQHVRVRDVLTAPIIIISSAIE